MVYAKSAGVFFLWFLLALALVVASDAVNGGGWLDLLFSAPAGTVV